MPSFRHVVAIPIAGKSIERPPFLSDWIRSGVGLDTMLAAIGKLKIALKDYSTKKVAVLALTRFL